MTFWGEVVFSDECVRLLLIVFLQIIIFAMGVGQWQDTQLNLVRNFSWTSLLANESQCRSRSIYSLLSARLGYITEPPCRAFTVFHYYSLEVVAFALRPSEDALLDISK
ncbi:hypothetical protein BDR04DRAFT_515213 [Suillus decipiens]|nr:hypothetical protein BDR04DRAFT_515213 [Suillus decipiens]